MAEDIERDKIEHAATLKTWEDARALIQERSIGAKAQYAEVLMAMQVRINALRKAGE